MVRMLAREDLRDLGWGLRALGSGGGGATALWELMLSRSPIWPHPVFDVAELDAATPCVAASFGGSTLFLGERIPGEHPFAPLVDAAERWTGVRADAVVAVEGAGLNGLSPFLLAPELAVIDADFMGRALPRYDQISLFADRVPGIVTVCGTGADGVVVIDSSRPDDVESLIRTAIVRAGGVAPVLLAGFTVGDLIEHAIHGYIERALGLGADFTNADAELPDWLGARRLCTGRVVQVESSSQDALTTTVEIAADDGGIIRLINQSEVLMFMRDGEFEVVAPDIILTLDTISREIVQADQFITGRHVSLFSLAVSPWWRENSRRAAQVEPYAYGLSTGGDSSWGA